MPRWEPPPLPAYWTAVGRPAFVGRRPELAALERAWSLAVSGQGQAVFIGGEPGAGKTRLLAEAAAALQRRGGAVLVGTCGADLGPPYQPLDGPAAVLLDAVRTGGLAPRRPVGAVFPAPAGGADSQTLLAAVAGDGLPELTTDSRRQLYESLLAAVVAVAQRQPLVLALEDVHWAGEAGVSLLAYLVERITVQPVLILATHRTTPPDRSEPLVGAVAALHRLDGVRRLDLPPLDTEAIADYLIREAGGPARPVRAAAAVLRDRTGGNPYLLREVWRDLASKGGVAAVLRSPPRAPASVSDMLATRLRQLSADSRRVLELAAVIGEHFESAVLLAATGLPQQTTLQGLDDGVERALLERVDAPAGEVRDYRFVHALARQVLLEQRPPSRLVQDHARVAQVLHSGFAGVGNRTRRLADHFAAAQSVGFAEEAVHYLAAAAAQARQTLAHLQAARLDERAAAIAGQEQVREDLLLDAARDFALASDFADAVRVAKPVAETGSPVGRLSAAIIFEEACLRPGLVGDEAARLLAAAIAGVDATGSAGTTGSADAAPSTGSTVPDRVDPPQLWRARASLARALAFTGALDEARQRSDQVITRARATADDDLLAFALTARVHHPARRRDLADLSAFGHELATLAVRSGDGQQLGSAAWIGALVGYLTGDRAAMDRGETQLQRVAPATGGGWWAYWADCHVYARQFVGADLVAARATAERMAELGAALGQEDTEGPFGVQVFMVQRETGGLDRLRPLVERIPPGARLWSPGLLALCTELGLDELSRPVLAGLLASAVHRESGEWPAQLVFMTEAALRLHDVAAARRLRPLVAEHSGLNLMAGSFVALFGSADRYLARLDAALGAGDPDRLFARALDLDTRTGSVLHQAETLAAWASYARTRPGQRQRGLELAEQALAIAEPRHLVRVCRAVAWARAPAGRPVRSDGLTPRELEVLRLLAAGLSNHAIATKLVVSEHTAANHVRSILAKTGARNRTQAARYAADHGLT